MKLEILSEEQQKSYLKLAKYYWREAVKCKNANIYLSGCIMLGSALETMLTLMVGLNYLHGYSFLDKENLKQYT